jgi:hypothetical protein
VGRSVFVDAMGKLMAKRYRPCNAILGEEKAKCQAASLALVGDLVGLLEAQEMVEKGKAA